MIVQLFALLIHIERWSESHRSRLRITFHWEPYPGIFIDLPRRHR